MKIIDKKNTYIDKSVKIGKNTVIYPNVVIEGNTIIGSDCIIYPGCYIKNSNIANNNIIYTSYIIESFIGSNNTIGPYANIRANNKIKDNNKIGAFVELKNNTINNNTKIPHLSYIGDSEIGSSVNIGCGVITANYDGVNKNKTIIEDKAFIGCNVNLVAPVKIGENSLIAAGSTITEDVEDHALAIARNRQTIKPHYNKSKKV